MQAALTTSVVAVKMCTGRSLLGRPRGCSAPRQRQLPELGDWGGGFLTGQLATWLTSTHTPVAAAVAAAVAAGPGMVGCLSAAVFSDPTATAGVPGLELSRTCSSA